MQSFQQKFYKCFMKNPRDPILMEALRRIQAGVNEKSLFVCAISEQTQVGTVGDHHAAARNAHPVGSDHFIELINSAMVPLVEWINHKHAVACIKNQSEEKHYA